MQRVSFDNSSASTTQCRGCTSPRLRQLHNRHALGLEQRLQRRLLLQLAHFPLWLPPEWLITAAPSESRHATAALPPSPRSSTPVPCPASVLSLQRRVLPSQRALPWPALKLFAPRLRAPAPFPCFGFQTPRQVLFGRQLALARALLLQLQRHN